MPQVLPQEEEGVYEVIGLGFGPANLAIAAAIVDHNHSSSSEHSKALLDRSLFIERNTEFRWHPGMLLPGARMQISFLKDIATLRSPQSPFTFLAYLHSQDRLLSFINRGTSTPTRKEYSDYLSWAADQVQENGIHVQYGEEVTGIGLTVGGVVEVRSLRLDTGEQVTRKARNLIISPGGTAKLPAILSLVIPHPRIIHSSTYATSIPPILASISNSKPVDRVRRIAVIGAGQSSAEILLNLHSRLSAGPTKWEVDLIFRKGCMKPSDDSPFANEIFEPSSTDKIFNLSQHARKGVLSEYRNTNYSVVNPRTLESLYEVIYDQKLHDNMVSRGKAEPSKVHIRLQPYTRISTVEEVPPTSGEGGGSNPQIRLSLQNILNHDFTEQIYDGIICGTGYERSSWVQLLSSSEVGKHFGLDTHSSINVELVPSREEVESTLSSAAEDVNTWSVPPIPFTSDNTSGDSTPLTSPGPSPSFSPTQLSPIPRPTKLTISRNYRLVPVHDHVDTGGFIPKIYLQGCTEDVHGLSESLLSILGVRAGLVVEDLLA